ncbi:hypothetical protein DMC47_01675 [Nostoc sp. 3335mG]|nr:hypothetical protein DMC47_01675 [Nostoc sp. 3335mG]
MVELGHPERPIQHPEEDSLSRDVFVQRLVAALINRETHRSSGIVVGVTGPWGSGKSSVLNLVAARIKTDHANAIVVRFDPWLVSGRNDLISSFIEELLSQLRGKDRIGALKGLADKFSEYGQQLAPAGELLMPGAGTLATASFAVVKKFTGKKTPSLNELRTSLNKALEAAAVPIVVLIDEVDRIEDTEIRAVAQLVRAVADFPSISYLLAYDADRVAEALGDGHSKENILERGRSYLEKIVQLQIPLPLTDDASIERMITKELNSLSLPLSLPSGFSSIERYGEMIQILAGGLIATPRDVSRLIGTYHALRTMLVGEVDWIDLLGYCVFLTKAPGIAARIKAEPGIFLAQTLSRRDAIREVGQSRLSNEERIRLATGVASLSSANKELLQELFPAFSEFTPGEKGHLDAISTRRSLLAALHLGLPPGDHSRESVVALLKSSANDVAQKLRTAYENDNIDTLLDRIEEIYPTLSDIDHLTFWSGAAEFSKKPDCSWMTSFQPMSGVIRSLSDILTRAVRRNRETFLPVAQRIFKELHLAGENELTAFWIRQHVFSFGMFGQEQRNRERAFFEVEHATEIVSEINIEMRTLHLDGRLIPCRWDLQPVYTLLDADIWDDDCRNVLSRDLQADEAADGLALMLFGANFTTDASFVDKMCGDGVLRAASERRLADRSALQESVLLAHEKVLEKMAS